MNFRAQSEFPAERSLNESGETPVKQPISLANKIFLPGGEETSHTFS